MRITRTLPKKNRFATRVGVSVRDGVDDVVLVDVRELLPVAVDEGDGVRDGDGVMERVAVPVTPNVFDGDGVPVVLDVREGVVVLVVVWLGEPVLVGVRVGARDRDAVTDGELVLVGVAVDVAVVD